MTLAGKRVLVTRPRAQAEGLAARIRQLHGEAEIWPLMEIETLFGRHGADADRIRARLESVSNYDQLLVVSGNAARELLRWLAYLEIPAGTLPPCRTVGHATAAALRAGGVDASCPNDEMNSEGLLALDGLQNVAGQRILLCRGEGGRTLIASTLRQRQAMVDEVALYRRLKPAGDGAALLQLIDAGQLNAIQLGSLETLENLLSLLGSGGAGRIAATVTVLVPSARVADAARDAGLRHVKVCAEPTDDGILAELQRLEC